MFESCIAVSFRTNPKLWKTKWNFDKQQEDKDSQIFSIKLNDKT